MSNKTYKMKISIYLWFFWISYVSSQRKAQIMCEEYAKAVFQTQDDGIFSLRTRIPVAPVSTCALYENPLIVGGTPARAREFPHMAVIGYGPSLDSELDWFCGGSLISRQHILTAAHCTISRSGPPQKVRLGTINLDENDDYVQEVVVDSFMNHPEYKRPSKYHDIALLLLQHPVEFTAFVRPACLNTVEDFSKFRPKATGFGKTTHESYETSKVLLKVDLDVIPRDVCNQYMVVRKTEMPDKVTEKMVCAGRLEGGKDTCQGDSGGPLQIVMQRPYCMYGIIGVTSFGRFCGMRNSPGVYTKVDQYVNWIENMIWP